MDRYQNSASSCGRSNGSTRATIVAVSFLSLAACINSGGQSTAISAQASADNLNGSKKSASATSNSNNSLNQSSASSGSTNIPSTMARWAVDMVQEEAIGPFASWANVKTDYGAIGDGVADDTNAFQSALNDLGHIGKSQVLYLPAGTYKVTSTLNLNGSQVSGPGAFGWGGVSIIGQDPSLTTIKWSGPSGQPMLIQNGGLGTRYSRITWDGSGVAGFGVAQWWNAKGGGLLGGNTEHEDEVFQDMNIGIMAGRLGDNYGQMDSEGQIRRVTFIRNTYAGVDVGSWNALDWWVWDSHFVDCARGVSNQFSLNDSGVTTGAGAIYVYRSLFERSTIADMSISNTGWFSLHNNVSIGSRRIFEATPMGSNSGIVIIQNNRVVQSTNPVPISLGNVGPMFLVDNQIQANSYTYELTDWIGGRDVLSLGNTISAQAPPVSGSDRLISIDDVTVAAAGISTPAMTLPATPALTMHQVYEVASGATADQIQSIINKTAESTDPLPIVHFGHGTWTLNKSLQIPKSGRLQLVGDGFGSVLQSSGAGSEPMLSIGPASRVTIRDMQWLSGNTPAITISGADQSGGRIQIVGSMVGPLSAAHLEMTQLSLQANPSISSITFADVVHAVAISNGGIGPVSLAADSSFLMADTWYEGSDTTLFQISSATFTYLGGQMGPATHPGAVNVNQPAIPINGLSGTASWIGMEMDLNAIPSGVGIEVENEIPQTQAYFMGLTSNRPNYFQLASGNANLGTVGFILNRTVQGSTNVQASNAGAASDSDVRTAWSQARSLSWDSTPYNVPSGATDIRVYHMMLGQTGGVVINGQ